MKSPDVIYLGNAFYSGMTARPLLYIMAILTLTELRNIMEHSCWYTILRSWSSVYPLQLLCLLKATSRRPLPAAVPYLQDRCTATLLATLHKVARLNTHLTSADSLLFSTHSLLSPSIIQAASMLIPSPVPLMDVPYMTHFPSYWFKAQGSPTVGSCTESGIPEISMTSQLQVTMPGWDLLW